MFLQAPHRVLVILLALWTGGCANPTTAYEPMRVTGQLDQKRVRATVKSSSGSVDGFDKILTKAEKRTVIRDLQKAGDHARQARPR